MKICTGEYNELPINQLYVYIVLNNMTQFYTSYYYPLLSTHVLF